MHAVLFLILVYRFSFSRLNLVCLDVGLVQALFPSAQVPSPEGVQSVLL